MQSSFSDLLALITIAAWPIIPLFWIPVHLFPRFFKTLKFFTYVLPLITWLPVVYLVIQFQQIFFLHRITFPALVSATGVLLLITGTLLHVWTGWLLGLSGLIGVPEVNTAMQGTFVTRGAFCYVRHPTYLAHTLMFCGVFLITGVVSTGILALGDFVIVNIIIIPLEERELLARFGGDFERYKKAVPRFFPASFRPCRVTGKN